MPKIIKIITTILLIYFVSCLIIFINIKQNLGYYNLFIHYMNIIYLTYVFSLLVFLIFSWKYKRSIIYFLLILGIIIYNYSIIVINQTDNIIPNYRFLDPLFLTYNYGNHGWDFANLMEHNYAMLPYYLLFLLSIYILINFLISNFNIFNKGKPIILKILNVISIILIIYFISCLYFLLLNAEYNNHGNYKFIPEMYILYVVSLILFLLFKHNNKLSISYFLFILIIIIYNYIIILTNHGVDTAPLLGYNNKFLIYNGYYAKRYSGLLQVYKFKVIFPYILLMLGNICVIIDYVICKFTLLKRKDGLY